MTSACNVDHPRWCLVNCLLRFWPGFLLAVVLVALMTAKSMADRLAMVVPYNCEDVGFVYTLARMAWEGAVQYRDFIHEYGPLHVWSIGPLFTITGVESMRAVLLAADVNMYFLGPLGIYLVTWRLCRRTAAAWGAMLLFLAAFCTYFDVRTVMLMGALWVTMLLKDRSPRAHALIGMAIGVAWLSGIQAGIFAGYGYVLLMAYQWLGAPPPRLSWRQAAARVAGMGVGFALALGVYIAWYLARGGSLSPLVYTWFVRAPFNTASFNLPFLFGVDPATRLYTFCQLTPALCLLPILFLLFSDAQRTPGRAEFLLWSLAVLTMQLYALGRADIGHVCIGAVFFAPALVYMLWNREHLCMYPAARSAKLLAAWLALVALEFAIFFHNETLNALQVLLVLLAALLVTAADRGAAAVPRRSLSPWECELRGIVTLGALVLLLAYCMSDRVASFREVLREVTGHPRRCVRRLWAAPPPAPEDLLGMRFDAERLATIRRLCERINQDPATQAVPYVFIFPEHCFLYNLLQARNPTPQFLCASFVSDREDRQAVRDLEAKRPPLVVLHTTAGPACSAIIQYYILTHYHLEDTIGCYSLYRRNAEGKSVEHCLTAHPLDFRPAAGGEPAVWGNDLKPMPGHPDELFAHPPSGAAFVWKPSAGTQSLRAEALQRVHVWIEPCPDAPDAHATATVKAVRQGGPEELLCTVDFPPGGQRLREIDLPIAHPETLQTLSFSSDCAEGTYWKINAEFARSDGSAPRAADPRTVNWSRLHYGFVKHTTAKEYTYANYVKIVPEHVDDLFCHPPYGNVVSVRRGFGAGEEMLNGLCALQIRCAPNQVGCCPTGTASVIVRRKDGQQATLWSAPPTLPSLGGWNVTLAVERPETIAEVEFSADYTCGTYWRICGVYADEPLTLVAQRK